MEGVQHRQYLQRLLDVHLTPAAGRSLTQLSVSSLVIFMRLQWIPLELLQLSYPLEFVDFYYGWH